MKCPATQLRRDDLPAGKIRPDLSVVFVFLKQTFPLS